jgi:hypothetical protein
MSSDTLYVETLNMACIQLITEWLRLKLTGGKGGQIVYVFWKWTIWVHTAYGSVELLFNKKNITTLYII